MVLVAVSTKTMVSVEGRDTYARVPSGVTSTCNGWAGVAIVVMTLLVAVSITATMVSLAEVT